MKNILLIIVGFLIVAGVGAFVMNQNSTSDSTMMMDKEENSVGPDGAAGVGEEKMDKDTEDSGTDKPLANNKSRYVVYTENVFEQTADTRRVLFFYANWCPTCRPSDASFQQNKDLIPEDVTVIRVNYNDSDTDENEKALANKYGVTYQHTFVQIDNAGGEVVKWNGGQIDQLLANIK
jgi:thiol-disulfide isomerase/thioredoxin